ncbi:carboxymuconolactone decarboxylase family protein [Myxococcota bacterium]|nr:carboxymuconolactone decarboxylase family protein [Myxococcota bacterium]
MRDPKTRRQRGLDVLSTLGGSEENAKGMAQYFESRGALGTIALYTGAGEIWSRDEMSRRDRSLVVISALTALGRETELRAHIAGGLNHGLSVDEIDEIFVQVAVYAGVPFGLAAAGIADPIFAERDGAEARKTSPAPLEIKEPEARRADGLEFLKTLLGQPNLDLAEMEKRILESQGFMGDLVIDYAFGDIWVRPQLSRRDRSLVVISVLTALNLKHELEIHLQGALNHGVTRVEIEEMLLTQVLYSGFPRAIDGMILARKVFAQADEMK